MENNICKLALDVGNSKVKLMLGEISADGQKLRILDYVEQQSEGIKRSVIEDSEHLTNSIALALKELEERTGEEFDTVSLSISSDRIVSKTEHGSVDFEEKEISIEEIEALVEQVKSKIVQEDEVIIEREIYNIKVGNSGILRNPIGQIGTNLKGDVHFVTIKESEIQKLLECVNKAGLEVEDVFLAASSSAKATLTLEDRQMGVALIDIGEGSTDIAIYKNDKMIYTKSLTIGGMHFVNDISYILKISKKSAKEIIEKLRMKDIKDNKIICETGCYDVTEIREIIEARTGDLIDFISKTIEESGFNGYLGKGLVFTGGAILVDDIFTKVGSKMGYSIRKEEPFPVRGMEKPTPSMSTILGVILRKLQMEYENKDKEESKVKREKVESIVNNESEKVHESFIEEDDTFRQEDFEEDFEEEEEEEKEGFFRKIGKVISNFI